MKFLIHSDSFKLFLLFIYLFGQSVFIQNTALHLAALKNHAGAAACLLSRGATILQNRKKRTPIDVAISERNHSVTNVFVTDPNWRTFLDTQSLVYGTVALGLTQHAPNIMRVPRS